MKRICVLLVAVLTGAMISDLRAQQPGPERPQSTESVSETTYHLVMFAPEYRFLSTTGYAGRVGEYDSLQQSVGGDLSFKYISFPQHMMLRTTANVLTRDDYDVKSRLTFGKTLDIGLDMRSFLRHGDDNPFSANIISPDIVRTDTIPSNALFGIKRTMNSTYAKVKLPNIPVKLFINGGWQARRGETQMQYFDMGGSGDLATDQANACANCHSGSQFRSINYTTRNIAFGAEAAFGGVRLKYSHEVRSFNDRLQDPSVYFGSMVNDFAHSLAPGVPDTLAGNYVINVLARNRTQADALQVNMAVAHHVTFNGDANYARTTDLITNHPQNAFNADTTLMWDPVSRLHALVDFHQQNLLNDFIPDYSLYGNPSLHRHWADAKLRYRVVKQVDVETYYKRMNITRSNAFLWPQAYSPDNADPLQIIPTSFSNTVGTAIHWRSNKLWNVRTGYEWTGTHDPGYVTDPHTGHRMFASVTLMPVRWFTFNNDASILLQRSFPAVQRSNHVYVNTSYVTLRPMPQWNLALAYTYMQDNLQTDMIFATDPVVAVYAQSLVPYKQLSQTYSVRSTYEVKKRLGLGLDFSHSAAHSSMRPDLNPNNYPAFPGVSPSDFSSALALGAGPISQVNIPQAILGSAVNYHFPSGFDAGLKFNYSSYRDVINPDQTGYLRSYIAFLGRTW